MLLKASRKRLQKDSPTSNMLLKAVRKRFQKNSPTSKMLLKATRKDSGKIPPLRKRCSNPQVMTTDHLFSGWWLQVGRLPKHMWDWVLRQMLGKPTSTNLCTGHVRLPRCPVSDIQAQEIPAGNQKTQISCCLPNQPSAQEETHVHTHTYTYYTHIHTYTLTYILTWHGMCALYLLSTGHTYIHTNKYFTTRIPSCLDCLQLPSHTTQVSRYGIGLPARYNMHKSQHFCKI